MHTVATESVSPFAIEQKATASWDFKGKKYYRYSATVTNKSSKAAKDLNISIFKLYGQLWGLSKSEDCYHPTWLESLPAGESFEFVYIQSAEPAEVSVAGYTLI